MRKQCLKPTPHQGLCWACHLNAWAMGAKSRPNLFISYRRADASGSAGRLFDWLIRQFGRANVFLDTDKILLGADFARVLAERLDQTDVLLAVIGPQWLDIENQAGRRLDQPDDSVRIEIATALARGTRVIPVLVDGAAMPSADQLPEPLNGLARRNAAIVRDDTFEQDFDLLVDDLLGRPRNYLRREFDRMQRLLLALKVSTVLLPALVTLTVLGLWLGALDRISLNIGAASHLLALAGTIAPERPDPGVLLVTIDESSQSALGRSFGPSPAWRQDHARLIARAAEAGAEAVVFDLFFERPTTADQPLAEAAGRARAAGSRVVFGVRALDQGQPRLLPPLRDAAEWGSVCLKRPLGHYSYSSPLAILRDGRSAQESVRAHTPALALAASQRSALAEVDIARRQIRLRDPAGGESPRFSTIERIRYGWGDCDTLAVGDEVAMLMIQATPRGYWREPTRRVSFADALRRDSVPDERLRGRILLVGVTLPRHDEHLVNSGFSHHPVYGVELHADAIAALVTGREILTPTLGTSASIMVLMTLLGAITGFASAPWTRASRISLLSGIALGYLAIAVFFASRGLLANVLYDLTAFAVAYAALRYLRRGGFERSPAR